MPLKLLLEIKVKVGLNGRKNSLRLLRTSLRKKRSILSALWLGEFAVVNTKELFRLVLSTLIFL